MNVRCRVELTQDERNELLALLGGSKLAARKLKRAQVLLAADAGVGDEDIATSVGVGVLYDDAEPSGALSKAIWSGR